MPDSKSYHLAELNLVGDPHDSRRCVPNYDCGNLDVLDVGCGLGQTLTAREFSGARSRHGIDPDGGAIELGRSMFPELSLNVATAESIPYGDSTFDLVFSRVALPYTNIPIALREMIRVTRPGGRVWLSLHSWRAEQTAFWDACRTLNARRILDRCYVLANSTWFALSGHCLRRPWTASYETFQFVRPMVRTMDRLGLTQVALVGKPHFCLTGLKRI